MNGFYDWATVMLFAVLATIFLRRSWGEPVARDAMWRYLPAAAGCVAANLLGNAGHHRLAWAALVVTAIAIAMRLVAPYRR